VYRMYETAREILTIAGFQYEDIERDAHLVTQRLELTHACMLRSVFYRGKGAFLIGKALNTPIVIALRSTVQGVYVDAVLSTEDEISILFSFTRSYFHVEAERPYDLVRFLHSIMPRKRISELYTSIGYHKHGKTELYRDLLNHLAQTDDQFE